MALGNFGIAETAVIPLKGAARFRMIFSLGFESVRTAVEHRESDWAAQISVLDQDSWSSSQREAAD
jgi:hypothetical protein